MRFILSGILFALAYVFMGVGVQAQDYSGPAPWQLCTQDSLAEFLTSDTGAEFADAETQFTSDDAQVTPLEARLRGDVVIERGDMRLQASSIVMDRPANRIFAKQGVTLGSPAMVVTGERAELDLNTETSEFDDVSYYMADRNAQGDASHVTLRQAQRQSDLTEVTYSTCNRGDEFWKLRAGRLELDQERGRGVARDVTIAIKDVPVMYFPYLSFPIDDQRHSGFLVPRVGFNEDDGLDIRIPYYWNIAPNQDATIAPRILSERGVMLGAEYRFLHPKHRGEVEFEYMPDDRKFNGDRGAFRIAHQANPTPALFTDLLYQYVSDDEYLDDLGTSLDLLNPNFLERRLDAVYYSNNWNVLARMQGFQTLDSALYTEENQPYDRLPQVIFNGLWPDQWFGLDFDLRGEWVYFDHDTKVKGNRFDIDAGIRLPLRTAGSFLEPSLSLRHTSYYLDDVEPGAEDRPDRTLPVASLDGGLFFERPVQWSLLGAGIHTLEPRFFYLYVPFKDQTDIPLFDTVDIDQSFDWLFLENSFTGADRVNDANQITTALTTRFLDAEDGRERLSFSIGQIHYFANQRVTLDNTEQPSQQNSSDIISQAQIFFENGFSLRGGLQWNPDGKHTSRSALDLRYRPDEQRLVNLSYRFASGELEQVDTSFVWSVNERWRTIGRWNYSLRESRTLDAFAGFEYGDCCWALRMLGRHHRDDLDDAQANNSVYLELELKGLGGIGNRIDSLLEKTILGYEPIRYR